MILKNSEKKENNKLHFTVESDAAEFEAAVQNAYRKNKGKIQIPGFRKGKAPMAVIEGMYGPEVFYQDALDDLCQSAFEAGLGEGENEIEFIGRPSVIMADVSEQRTAVYTFEVELYPFLSKMSACPVVEHDLYDTVVRPPLVDTLHTPYVVDHRIVGASVDEHFDWIFL